MALKLFHLLQAFFLFITLLSFSQSEIFLALTHMTDLVQIEQIFGSHLEEYLHQNALAPPELKRLASDVTTHVKDVQDADMEVFLGHPVNSYLLVWRFLKEWGNVVDKLDETNPIGQGNHRLQIPSQTSTESI